MEIKELEDGFSLVIVAPRLCYIQKKHKRKQGHSLVALYAGFDSADAAEKFEGWVRRRWEKSDFEIETRPGERTQSGWEVKVRRPKQEHLNALLKKLLPRDCECRPSAELFPAPRTLHYGRRYVVGVD